MDQFSRSLLDSIHNLLACSVSTELLYEWPSTLVVIVGVYMMFLCKHSFGFMLLGLKGLIPRYFCSRVKLPPFQ